MAPFPEGEEKEEGGLGGFLFLLTHVYHRGS